MLQELLHLLSSLFLLYLLGCSYVLVTLVYGSRRKLELHRLTPLLARRGYVEDTHCIGGVKLFLCLFLFGFFIQSGFRPRRGRSPSSRLVLRVFRPLSGWLDRLWPDSLLIFCYLYF